MKSFEKALFCSAMLTILAWGHGCGSDDSDGSSEAMGGSGASSGNAGAAGQVGGTGGGSGGQGLTGGTGGTAGTGGSETTGGAGGDSGQAGQGAQAGDAGSAGQAGQGGGAGCARNPGPDDFVRKVVVGHNKGPGGISANKYEVLNLSADGKLTRPGVTFEMAEGEGQIVFTPDGEVGIVAQGQAKERSLGVFRFDQNGTPHVVHQAFEPSFYPDHIVMHPSGQFAYVMSKQWEVHGGGIHRIDIGCDGTLSEGGIVLPAKLPHTVVFLDQDRAFLASSDVLGSSPSEEAHLINLGTPPTRLASSDGFGDDDAIVSAVAVTADGRYALLGDDSMFGGERVGVVAIKGNSLAFTQVLDGLPVPTALIPSPNNDVVLVVNGYPDDIRVLDYDPSNSSKPFSVRGKLAYQGVKPALPDDAIMIERGALAGRVLVAELYGVRQVQFTSTAPGVQDLGLFEIGKEFEDTVTALGVQK